MSLAGVISAGAAILGTVATISSANSASDAARSQRRAAAVAQRQQDLANARQRRELIRARRIAAADNLARGVDTGALGSSALAGVQSALNTNFASNLNYLDQNISLNQQRSSFLSQANQSSARSAVLGAYGSLGFATAGRAFDIYRNTPEYNQLLRR